MKLVLLILMLSDALFAEEAFKLGTKAGEQWVAPDGSIYCWCPPTNKQPGFWIGKYEVTQSKWQGKKAVDSEIPNLPVTNLSIKELRAVLTKLNETEHADNRLSANWEYALPTLAQWTYAAKAGTQNARTFPDADLPKHANVADRSLLDTGNDLYLYADNKLNDGHAHLAPVGSYLPNPWGIHDIFGNVWEITEDGTLCGGSWVSPPDYCRADAPKIATTIKKANLYPSDFIGFRMVIRPIALRRK